MSMFLDEAKINIKAGDGGAGLVSFFFLKGSHKKVASGGNGGKGGDVIFKASRSVATLAGFRKKVHFKAENGKPGMPNNRQGGKGSDCIINVPIGTIIKFEDIIYADLNYEGAEYTAASGGIGGRGNASFVSQARRFPGFAEKGETVPDRWINLELRLLADVALVGFPNAGKSTIISKISSARPKIADYPFTTLIPNLGVVSFDEDSFVVADIPGLIEGAHNGVGLGDRFLRHILRSKLIVMVLDVSILLIDGPGKFIQTYKTLREELKLYNISLHKKPFFTVINKTDLTSPEDEALRKILDNAIGKIKKSGEGEVLEISAATKKGLAAFIELMHKKILGLRKEEEVLMQDSEGSMKTVLQNSGGPEEESYKVYSLDNLNTGPSRNLNLDKIELIKYGKEYTVKNKKLERMVSMTDLENEEALNYLRDRLKKMGIGDKLKKMGVAEGSTVIIGNLVFELLE